MNKQNRLAPNAANTHNPTEASSKETKVAENCAKRAQTAPPTKLRKLTWTLMRHRFASGQGSALLFVIAILSALVTATLTLTVAGGAFMFWQRTHHPQGLLAELVAQEPIFVNVLKTYFYLAVLACALLIPIATRLTASSTVLGAKGREARLSALRLLGLSASDVTRMALLEATIQAVCGIVLGTILYYATLPAWQYLEMEAVPINPVEMVLPWPLLVTIDLVLLGISVLAAALGMRHTRVTPLGVARQAKRMRLSRWRPLIAAGAMTGGIGLAIISLPHGLLGGVFFLTTSISILLVIVAIVVFMPWLFEHLAGAASHLPGTSIMVAARRVQADAISVWRRVGSMALLGFITGFACYIPLSTGNKKAGGAVATFSESAQWDIQKGVLITLAIGLVLAAVSTLITQAGDVFDRVDEVHALEKMGVKVGFAARVSWIETLAPLILALATATLLGVGIGYSSYIAVKQSVSDALVTPSPWTLLLVIATGVLLTALALLTTMPLRRHLRKAQSRLSVRLTPSRG